MFCLRELLVSKEQTFYCEHKTLMKHDLQNIFVILRRQKKH